MQRRAREHELDEPPAKVAKLIVSRTKLVLMTSTKVNPVYHAITEDITNGICIGYIADLLITSRLDKAAVFNLLSVIPHIAVDQPLSAHLEFINTIIKWYHVIENSAAIFFSFAGSPNTIIKSMVLNQIVEHNEFDHVVESFMTKRRTESKLPKLLRGTFVDHLLTFDQSFLSKLARQTLKIHIADEHACLSLYDDHEIANIKDRLYLKPKFTLKFHDIDIFTY